ncbi:energy transducer TonB [Sphingomonas qomolangmaensis]|uniref:Energy transducer TonB n=1 Tax=Sphingomonas qomolangmaensis TaxID=2918765 RepID=A0ABY5L998_9SPHN|nr:energy transducer TonB [Sphingomonas qomolangmaensis]UUL83530.1 energy transducer TonB [Sphingomonas qomolangmaensis]
MSTTGIGILLAATMSMLSMGQAADQQTTGTAPRPLPSASFMTDDDYPADARRAGLEGTTHLSMDVDSKGRPTGCSIVQTSGVQSLDAASCRVFSRLKFRPARDGDGSAVAGVFVTKLRWALPGT